MREYCQGRHRVNVPNLPTFDLSNSFRDNDEAFNSPSHALDPRGHVGHFPQCWPRFGWLADQTHARLRSRTRLLPRTRLPRPSGLLPRAAYVLPRASLLPRARVLPRARLHS